MMKLLQVGVTLCSVLLAHMAAAEALVIGTLSSDPRLSTNQYTPFSNHLAISLAPAGITKVQVLALSNSGQMSDALARHQVDLFIGCPLLVAKMSRETGATPFLRRLSNGASTHQSVIVVPTDSSIKTIADMAGRRIGMEGPDSITGFLLPALTIDGQGFRLEQLGNRTIRPQANNIGFIFTADHKNTVFWLVMGWIDAAATDASSFRRLDKARPGQYRVLAQSTHVPKLMISHRAELSPDLIVEISNVLIDMKNTQSGVMAMRAFDNTRIFDTFPMGLNATFAPFFEMLDRFENLGLK